VGAHQMAMLSLTAVSSELQLPASLQHVAPQSWSILSAQGLTSRPDISYAAGSTTYSCSLGYLLLTVPDAV
jgi:hypothetical protein